ncbi:hypothetical protein [Achromobacter sp.]|uniref:hypothetical protein n=1 Tax=Achromobacter sp. TaxID=134375 RepID=UPI000ECFE1FF|nr:hypothetical protein [Achromobacter sp.]HCW18467.1 hypothetical protein [Achromobacter sp.]
MAKSKYILLRKIIGAGSLLPGAVIELSPEQAAHPLYRTRVRKADGDSTIGALSVDVTAEAERILGQAKRAVEGMAADAHAEAERIVSAAQEEADRMLKEARDEADRIRADASSGSQPGVLTPASPGASDMNEKDRKALIVARLKELKVEHDGRKGADELATLLPDGDPLKPAAN